ncbi:hypothetical protein ACP70R_034879 [Stipagrostis hirtigluma subsp. patula]
MAELAEGAVSTLLGVIRNETLLLSGVQSDVQFIKEEMESMNSFLAHLGRSAPPGGEHEEQVRTWMNQVRFLAQDCNNCIDLYLYRGNPDVQRARGRIRRYLWWVYWFLHKLVAQHQAAIQLRELKERARDVGERRLRYGVEVPAKSAAAEQSPRAAGRSSWAQPFAPAAAGGYATGDDEDDGDDQYMLATATHHSGRRAYFVPRTVDEYVKAKLLEWVQRIPGGAVVTLSTAVMASAAYQLDVLDLARETLVSLSGCYDCVVLVDISAVHLDYEPLRPKEVLYYILHELKLKHSKFLSQVYEKLGLLYMLFRSAAAAASQHDQLNNKDTHKLPEWDDKTIAKIGNKFKVYMEADEKGKKLKEGSEGEEGEGEAAAGGGSGELKREEGGATGQGGQGGGGGEGAGEGEEETRADEENMKEKKENEKEKQGGEEEEEEEEDMKETKKQLQEEHQGQGEGDEQEERDVKEKREEAMGGGGSQAAAAADGGPENEGDGEGDDGSGNGDDVVDDDDDQQMQQMGPIHLHEAQYMHILREAFPNSGSKPLQAQVQDRLEAKQAANTTFGEDQIKQMIEEAKQVILRELQEGKYDKNETGETGSLGQNTEAIFKEIIEQKMDKIRHEFKEQLKIKGLVDNIKYHLNGVCPLFILKVDEKTDISKWEDIRNALSLLELSADVLIVTTTNDTKQAKEYCYPPLEPIDYSLVGLYHDTVLRLTSHLKNEDNYDPQLFRDILKECEPHEFCMKLFTHALFANPQKSNEDLIKLSNSLHDSPKSFDIIAKKMFKFSYSELPKEYKSCLLYLAIFPPGHNIKRSTLIGRWVAEGLIFKEDWLRSVRQANRCFDMLINRWLVYPADIGATGKVKSCVVSNIVHGFITKIARKQHIVEPRLSRHLARHFSIFNDLHLRSSEGIQDFFQRLSKLSRVSLLKVLDLEGCHCFGGKNQRYLKEICHRMLLLKYLSLRGTDITQLPSEINHLRELELLDIRQTKVPEYATRHVLLLKLKRLLAGPIDSNLNNSDNGTAIRAEKLVSTVQIPHNIGKMINLEVLSDVKAQNSHDLKDIGKLCYLRKLGVVIDDNSRHLRKLLQAISDLHECLLSLSITVTQESTHSGGLHKCLRSLSINATQEGTHSSEVLPVDIGSHLKNHLNLLESLSIRGKPHLLSLFIKPGNDKLTKVTLSSTSLNEDNLEVLDKLPNLRCVKLRDIACTDSVLTFKENAFKYLKYLLVERSHLTRIIFEDGAASELEKMVLSSNNIRSVSRVESLEKLEEVELNNNNARLLSSFHRAIQVTNLTLCGTLLKQGDLQILAKHPNMRYLMLLNTSFEVIQITFNKDEFPKLNILTVDCSGITKIDFTSGSAPKLEKIVWSSCTSLSGIENLPRLKELEVIGDIAHNEVEEAVREHKNKPHFKHTKPGQAIRNTPEAVADAISLKSLCWKNQV